MNLHEYQSKQLFAEYGLPVLRSVVCSSAQEALNAAQTLGGDRWVIKCQVHAGGRGKAGGVKLVKSEAEIIDFANRWLGKRLVSNQTDAQGQPVNKLLLEACTDILDELYLSVLIDRSLQKVVVIASSQGGMDIEAVAQQTPELIHKTVLDPLVGPQPYQGRQLAFKLGLSGTKLTQFVDIFMKMTTLFLQQDVAMLEINPLVVTKAQELVCLDAKVIIDSNALFRHPKLQALADPSQEDERNAQASKWELNYVALSGNIGCMVNGAGLAMATMDMVQLHGGKPANFLDVGGGATQERVSEAFKIILSDPNVKAVLVNIFGGIVRGDLIADGIIGAVAQIGVNVPVVVRLQGNNAELGAQRLAESSLNIIAATSLTKAAQAVVAAAEGREWQS
ncbi:MAG: ADP-forming succinate--CoA ligase subunit beta [Vibrionaceae bacterium]